MRIPESAFDEVLARHGTITLPQISQASTSHTYIRDLLTNKSEYDATFPRFVDGDFISGSYGRGTKTPPLDDIDVMMPIDGTGFSPIRNGQPWSATVRSSGKLGNPLLDQLSPNGLLSSRRVMEIFHEGIKESYPNSTVAKDGQAINVWLESYSLGIDIVPCFHVVPLDGSQDVYYIPTGSNSEGWTMTNPKVDQKILDALHERHDKKLKPVIKLIKVWNGLKNAHRINAYHLETICYYIFHKHPGKITHPGLALMHFFEEAPAYLQDNCPDATGIGGHVDTYLLQAERQQSILSIQKAAGILAQSYMLGLADENQQLTGWRNVFDDNFAR